MNPHLFLDIAEKMQLFAKFQPPDPALFAEARKQAAANLRTEGISATRAEEIADNVKAEMERFAAALTEVGQAADVLLKTIDGIGSEIVATELQQHD